MRSDSLWRVLAFTLAPLLAGCMSSAQLSRRGPKDDSDWAKEREYRPQSARPV